MSFVLVCKPNTVFLLVLTKLKLKSPFRVAVLLLLLYVVADQDCQAPLLGYFFFMLLLHVSIFLPNILVFLVLGF